MTITAEESTQQIYDALIKVFKDAKVPKSNDVIPKVAALMKLMLAFIDGDGDLQLHPRSNMPGKVLRLMAEVAQAMPGVLVDFTAATGNGHRSVTYTSNTVVALLGNGDGSGESNSDEGAAQRSQNPRESRSRKAKSGKGSSGSASDDDDVRPSRKKPRKDKAKAAEKAPEDAQTKLLKRQKEEYEKDYRIEYERLREAKKEAEKVWILYI